MEKKKHNLSRRRFFQFGLGVAGTVAAQQTLGNACQIATGAQDKGPFFPERGTPVDPVRENPDRSVPISMANDNDLTFVRGRQGQASGQVAWIKGRVLDPNCQPVEGASITIWQASASGRYNHRGDRDNQDFRDPRDGSLIQRTLDPYFQSWGETKTNAEGEYEFKTIVPGFYPANLQRGWYRPPHIHFMVSALGFPQFVTQTYFRGDQLKDNEFIQELNEKDFLLQGNNLSESQREELIVEFEPVSAENNHELVGSFDIRLP